MKSIKVLFKAEKILRYLATLGLAFYGLLSLEANGTSLEQETIVQECENGVCQQKTIKLTPHQTLYLEKPRKDPLGRPVAPNKKELKRQYQMRYRDYQVGVCYIDSNRPDEYFYVTKVIPSDKMVWYVTESQDDPFWLRQKYFFYNDREFVRSHRKIPCEAAPNLGRTDYVNNCIPKKQRTGEFPCEDERLR